MKLTRISPEITLQPINDLVSHFGGSNNYFGDFIWENSPTYIVTWENVSTYIGYAGGYCCSIPNDQIIFDVYNQIHTSICFRHYLK